MISALNIMFLRFIHVLYIFLPLCDILLLNILQFVHSQIDGHCFSIFVITSNTLGTHLYMLPSAHVHEFL